jgi:hypothetical protein
MICRFAARIIDTVENVDDNTQAGTRVGAFHQLLDQRHTVEHDAFAGPCEMREEPINHSKSANRNMKFFFNEISSGAKNSRAVH